METVRAAAFCSNHDSSVSLLGVVASLERTKAIVVARWEPSGCISFDPIGWTRAHFDVAGDMYGNASYFTFSVNPKSYRGNKRGKKRCIIKERNQRWWGG